MSDEPNFEHLAFEAALETVRNWPAIPHKLRVQTHARIEAALIEFGKQRYAEGLEFAIRVLEASTKHRPDSKVSAHEYMVLEFILEELIYKRDTIK